MGEVDFLKQVPDVETIKAEIEKAKLHHAYLRSLLRIAERMQAKEKPA